MPNWRKELRDIIGRDIKSLQDAIDTASALYDNESHRGAALIAGSIAENALEQIMRKRLVSLSPGRLQELFGVNGTLGAFSAKIRIAFSFGIIDTKMRDEFDRIREIRNAFAHAKIPVSFDTPAIARGCHEFKEQNAAGNKETYIDAVFTLFHAATISREQAIKGHTTKLKSIISWDAVAASRDRSQI